MTEPAGPPEANLVAAVEALLFAAAEPVAAGALGEALEVPEPLVLAALDRLAQECRGPQRGIELRRVAGGWQLCTRPAHAGAVQKLLRPRRPGLSHAALETLAVVAYRQPVTRAEIEQLRGVNCERALATLVERGLVVEAGRRTGPGRPILYKTTDQFLSHFGLEGLDDLPGLLSFDGVEKARGGPAA